MQQIVLNRPGEFEARDVAVPVADEQSALVRVHRIGVCGTDLHAFAGRQPFFEYPRVLGHELGVEVLEVADNDRGIQVGDRCAIEPYDYCGSCHACGLGKTNCCDKLQVFGVHTDGGMQPIFSVPIHLLHKSTQLSLEQLALVETLGIGAHAVRRSQLTEGETALVVGAGPIGLSVIQFALATGAHVRVLEMNPRRREFVSQFNVETLAQPDDQLTEVVFDATGNKRAMEASFQYVHPGGRLVFVGLVLDSVTFEDPHLHRREITLLASRNSAGLFPRIIGMIEEGVIDTGPWITDRLSLGSVPQRFAGLPARPELAKAMIEVD